MKLMLHCVVKNVLKKFHQCTLQYHQWWNLVPAVLMECRKKQRNRLKMNGTKWYKNLQGKSASKKAKIVEYITYNTYITVLYYIYILLSFRAAHCFVSCHKSFMTRVCGQSDTKNHLLVGKQLTTLAKETFNELSFEQFWDKMCEDIFDVWLEHAIVPSQAYTI